MDEVVQPPTGQEKATTVGSPRWSKTGLGIARLFVGIIHHSLALAPFLVLAALYIFSWRVQALIGHWPQPSIDDPKFVAPGDWLCDFLYSTVIPLFTWAVAGIILLPLTTWFLRRQYPRWYLILLLCLFIAGLILLRADPGDRMLWYAD